MSRTPLFSRLQKMLRLAAIGEQQKISTAELVERAAEAQWSRRRFLKTAATAGAGAILVPTFRPYSPYGVRQGITPRIVIVGAGTAGLTCAYRLQQAGVMSQVLEAGKRVGGRMYSLRGAFAENQITELGGEFIDSDHESLLTLAQELGLTLVDLKAADGNLVPEVFYFNGRKVSETEVLDAFRPVAKFIDDDLNSLSGDGDVTYSQPNDGHALDRLSIIAWFNKHKITGLIRELLDVAYVGEYGLESDQQSCLNLLTLIGTGTDSFKTYGESDEQYHIAEGNDSVPTRLAERLARPVEFETRLEAVRQRSDDTYLLTVNQAGKVRDIEADEVVLALPFTMLRQVNLRITLPPAKRLAINTLGYGTNAKVIAGYSSRVWQAANSNGSSFSDLPYQATWETSRGQAGKSGIITDYLGGRRGLAVGYGSIEQQAIDFVGQFDKVFPGSKAAFTGKAARADWPNSPFVRASYACYRPGQYTTIRGAEGEPVGRLHFAGEHTSLIAQGYMDGASESGERAAEEILVSIPF